MLREGAKSRRWEKRTIVTPIVLRSSFSFSRHPTVIVIGLELKFAVTECASFVNCIASAFRTIPIGVDYITNFELPPRESEQVDVDGNEACEETPHFKPKSGLTLVRL